MTPADVALVLTKAAAYDQRTIGEADVVAWHEILDRYDLDDALAAVARWYTEHRERVMPADIVRHIRDIREERRRHEQRHEVRALPSRYESDAERDARNAENAARIRREIIAPLIARMGMPTWERSTRAPKGAWWEDEQKREDHAIQLLEEMGRLHIEAESP